MNSLFSRTVYCFGKTVSKQQSKKKKTDIFYNPFQALRLVRCFQLANFDESIFTKIDLNVDPRHGDQIVRGTLRMPHSLGQNKKLAIMTANKELRDECLQNGADIAVDDNLIKSIASGDNVPFEKFFATPESIPLLKPAARVLGPLGLMPNPKLGSAVSQLDLLQLVKDNSVGVVTFRVNDNGELSFPLGKLDKSDDFKIISNFKFILDHLVEKKPEKIKGKYFNRIQFKSTNGQWFSIKVDLVDPKSRMCIINEF